MVKIMLRDKRSSKYIFPYMFFVGKRLRCCHCCVYETTLPCYAIRPRDNISQQVTAPVMHVYPNFHNRMIVKVHCNRGRATRSWPSLQSHSVLFFNTNPTFDPHIEAERLGPSMYSLRQIAVSMTVCLWSMFVMPVLLLSCVDDLKLNYWI